MTNEIKMNKQRVRNSVSVKRPLENATEGSLPEKRMKLKDVPVNINGKNPAALLNELRPGLMYKLDEQSGPTHAPLFTMSVEIDGQVYKGSGTNKKKAKAKAAENALRSFIQFPNSNMDTSSSNQNIDFTEDVSADHGNADKKLSYCFVTGFPKLKPADLAKGPVMLLNELYPGLKYQTMSIKDDAFEKFKSKVDVNGEIFTGVGSSKKNSKNACARAALSKLLNMQTSQNKSPVSTAVNQSYPPVSAMQELADHIANMVCEKFATVMLDDILHSKRKVLAGIAMTQGDDKSSAQVISVTTGTKCVSGEHISMNGASLNDMHAEIVSRRCLIDFLYTQLEMTILPDKSDQSIFIRRSSGGGYQLKDGIKFHLYINTAPCGDARIFSPHEDKTSSVDKHPNRRARGQLRTKIESGEGTIPVKSSNSTQTWDGILQGERLLTMSCSDKIARWNILGLQGSLLSHFIEPIYLDSIILGSLLHPVHMYRAVCGRVEDTIQGLPPPYRLNRPSLSLTTTSEVRRPVKAPNFSVNWTMGQNKPEVVNCITGKTEQEIPSRLCKVALYKRFMYLLPKLSTIKEFKKQESLMYCDAKNAVETYNIAKQNLYDAFTKADLGKWIKKPLEQDQFEL